MLTTRNSPRVECHSPWKRALEVVSKPSGITSGFINLRMKNSRHLQMLGCIWNRVKGKGGCSLLWSRILLLVPCLLRCWT